MRRGFVLGLGIAVSLGGPALALTFTVDSTGDGSDTNAGDGTCVATSGGCTLRAAIEESNAHPDADTIAFGITGSGVHTIHPVGGAEGGSDLQFLVAPVTIDGFTQPGSQPNTTATGALDAKPTIELDGSGSFHCFVVFNTGTTIIRGLVINGCHSELIDLESGSTTSIEGNFIGTDPTGTVAKGFGSATGINMFVQNGGLTFTAGGTTPDKRNLISGNGGNGINVQANLSSSISATIQGNLIGTDKTGTAAIPNFNGVASFGAGTDNLVVTIGGSVAGEGNVVSGSVFDGIQLGHFSANSVVQGNLVGTAVDGTTALGNGRFGIAADATGPVTIGGTMPGQANVVAHSGSAGIAVTSAAAFISGNSIFSNGGLGIDVEAAQSVPVLAAGAFPGGTSIDGTLDSTPSATFRVEVFANDACDSSGNGEGQSFVGANDAVTTDGSGHADFTVTFAQSLPAGTILTATAIAPDGSTSEFGPCTAAPPTTTTTTTSTTTTTTSTSTTTSSSSTSTSTLVTTTSIVVVTTSTSSSSTTHTTTAPTSTTTTLAPACADVPDGPTFASILCRLEALRDATAAASALGDLRPKLDQPLGKAIDRTEAAQSFCTARDAKHANARLKQVIRQLIQYSHRLRGLHARKKAPAEVREPLAATADAIRGDAATLRRMLSCPGGT